MFIEAKNRKELAKKVNTAAYEVVKKVTGGYILFDNMHDFDVWKNQK